MSAQTVSKLTRDLDQAVRQFHAARLADDYAYLFLDGVSLRVRRPAGRKRVQMLVAYGVRRDGTRHLLAFVRSQGESQADWEALLHRGHLARDTTRDRLLIWQEESPFPANTQWVGVQSLAIFRIWSASKPGVPARIHALACKDTAAGLQPLGD